MAKANTQVLAQLRELAQQELDNIDTEKAQEVAQQTQAEAEIHLYAKMSSFDRKRQQTRRQKSLDQRDVRGAFLPDETPGDVGMKPRFKPFDEILHRLNWDDRFDIEEYVVGYLERFEGIKEIAARSWIRDFSDEEWIPMHRVRYVKRVRPAVAMVWDRDARLDRISKPDDDEVMSVDGASVIGGVSL